MSTGTEKALIATRETAHEWAARFDAADLSHADKEAFAAWLRASPIHVREYLNVEALRLTVRSALQRDTTDVAGLVGDKASNVVEFNEAPGPGSSEFSRSDAALGKRAATGKPKKSGLGAYQLAIAATLLIAFGAIVALAFPDILSRNAYITGIGEIRKIKLSDGSTVELNTQSKIRVDFAANRRDVHLATGEAFFTVSKDPNRPFRVFSDTARIQAIGTQFSVYRKPGQTVVTVVEGQVAALPASMPEAAVRAVLGNPAKPATAPKRDSSNSQTEKTPILLSAGHQVVIASNADISTLPQPASVDAKRMTAWRQNRLIFENEPLANVVAEFNRYNEQQLVVENPELAAQGISGVFDPDKPHGLILFLSKKGGVRTTELPNKTILLIP